MPSPAEVCAPGSMGEDCSVPDTAANRQEHGPSQVPAQPYGRGVNKHDDAD